MLKKLIQNLLNKAGYEIIRTTPHSEWPNDFEDFHKQVISNVSSFTMTSPERIYGLIEAIKYIEKHNINGEIVECGVWKGGSMLATALTLLNLNSQNRNLYLYDTFEGMPPPTDFDEAYNNEKAVTLLDIESSKKESSNVWAYSTLNEVKATMSRCKYPENRVHFIKGKVEETIPEIIPEKIALLRLDTDWYESTKHELEHLFPRLVSGGVLIIDDYGFWKGARKAVDEYFQNNKIPILLNRLDFTGRIGIKH